MNRAYMSKSINSYFIKKIANKSDIQSGKEINHERVIR